MTTRVEKYFNTTNIIAVQYQITLPLNYNMQSATIVLNLYINTATETHIFILVEVLVLDVNADGVC